LSSYKDRNKEINNLHLAFSRHIKTIQAAERSMSSEIGTEEAILNFHEVAKIYKKTRSFEKVQSCLNNIGCLYLKNNDFELSEAFIIESLRMHQEQIPEGIEKQMWLFMKACRLCNLGLVYN
jgi:hypothetical protein